LEYPDGKRRIVLRAEGCGELEPEPMLKINDAYKQLAA
jgi:hypothetical protein